MKICPVSTPTGSRRACHCFCCSPATLLCFFTFAAVLYSNYAEQATVYGTTRVKVSTELRHIR